MTSIHELHNIKEVEVGQILRFTRKDNTEAKEVVNQLRKDDVQLGYRWMDLKKLLKMRPIVIGEIKSILKIFKYPEYYKD